MTAANAAPIRSFIAVGVPAAARQALADAAGAVAPRSAAGGALGRARRMHLTLKFLGNINPAQVTPLLAALSVAAQETAPLALRLSGLGVFPNPRRPRVLWAGVAGDTDALAALQQSVERAAAAAGFPPESRPFAPHITLGRVRREADERALRQIGEAVRTAPPLPPSPWPVNAVHLMQSVPMPGGMRYAALGSAPFGRAASSFRQPDSGPDKE